MGSTPGEVDSDAHDLAVLPTDAIPALDAQSWGPEDSFGRRILSRLERVSREDLPLPYLAAYRWLSQMNPQEAKVPFAGPDFERLRLELCEEYHVAEGRELDEFLVRRFLDALDPAMILRRDDAPFILRLLVVYAARFTKRIPALSFKMKWAGETMDDMDEGSEVRPFLQPRYLPRATVVRMDLKNSVATRQARGRGMVRVAETFYFNRLQLEVQKIPEMTFGKSAGDEAVFVCEHPEQAEDLVARAQYFFVQDSKLSIEVGIVGNSPVFLLPTRDGRFIIAGEAYRKAEEVQKLSKQRDVDDLLGTSGVWYYDGQTPDVAPVPLDALVSKAAMSAVVPSLSERTLAGGRTMGTAHAIPVLDSDDLSGITGVFTGEFTGDDLAVVVDDELTFQDGFCLAGLDLTAHDLPERIAQRMAYGVESLHALQVDRLTHVQAGILNVKFQPPAEPDDPEDPLQLCAYGKAWESVLAPIEQLTAQHGMAQVYLDSSGVLIIGVGIYGTSPLNLSERLVRLAMDLLRLDSVEYCSQTLGKVAQGPLAGSENISGACVDLSARFQKSLYRSTRRGEMAPMILDEATFEALTAEGLEVRVLERKEELVLGFEAAGPKVFYLCAGVEFRRAPRTPFGYEEKFSDICLVLKDGLLRRGEGARAPEVARPPVSLLVCGDIQMGSREFLQAVGDQARVVGYRVLGEHLTGHLLHDYEWLRVVLDQIFGSDDYRFRRFAESERLDDLETLCLFFTAITRSSSSAHELKPYGEQVVERMTEVILAYARVEPLCLFYPDRSVLDESSRALIERLEQTSGDFAGLVLLEHIQTAPSAYDTAMLRSATLEVAALSTVEMSPREARYTLDPIHIDGIAAEQGLMRLSARLGFSHFSDLSDPIRQFFLEILGDEEWAPTQFDALVQVLFEVGYLEPGAREFSKRPDLSAFRETLSFDSVVRVRRDALSDEARSVFDLACFLGDSAEEHVLRQCFPNLDDAAFERACDHLEGNTLMRFGGGKYHFAQPFIPFEGRALLAVDPGVVRDYQCRIVDHLGALSMLPVSVDELLERAIAAEMPQRVLPAVSRKVAACMHEDPLAAEQLAERVFKELVFDFDTLSQSEVRALLDLSSTLVRVGQLLAREPEQVAARQRRFGSLADQLKEAHGEVRDVVDAEHGRLLCFLGGEHINTDELERGLALLQPVTKFHRQWGEFYQGILGYFNIQELPQHSGDSVATAVRSLAIMRNLVRELSGDDGQRHLYGEALRFCVIIEAFLSLKQDHIETHVGASSLEGAELHFDAILKTFSSSPDVTIDQRSRVASRVARLLCAQDDFDGALAFLAQLVQEAGSEGRIQIQARLGTLRFSILGNRAESLFDAYLKNPSPDALPQVEAALDDCLTQFYALSRLRLVLRGTNLNYPYYHNGTELLARKGYLQEDEGQRNRYFSRALDCRQLLLSECDQSERITYASHLVQLDALLASFGVL